MQYQNRKFRNCPAPWHGLRPCRGGLTILEIIIALAIITIIFAAVLPQFRVISNGWDSRQAGTEVLQNGRVLIDHISRNLSKAVKITAVEPNEYIQFLDNDSNTYQYDINSTSGYVRYGRVGYTLSDLAGPVSSLTFTCYDACDIATADVNDIRYVNVETTLPNPAALGHSETFTASIYLRANANNGGIVGCWKLDETSGTTAADSSGKGNNGTLVNMTDPCCWIPAQIGNALSFDGTDDGVNCSNASNLNLDIGSWGAWVKLDAPKKWAERVIFKEKSISSGTGIYELFDWSGFKTEVVVGGVRYGAYSPSSTNTGQWYHLFATYDGETLRLYVDGEEVANNTSPSGNIDDNTGPLGLGTRVTQATFAPFYGIIDDVRIYNRALTATEIAQLANILTYRGFTEAKAPFDTNTSIAVPIPTGTSAGNLLIAAVATDGTTSLTTPAGWELIDYGDWAGQVTLGAWWKIAVASESSPTFTWTGVGQQAYSWIMRFTGQNAANLIPATYMDGQTSISPISPYVTTSVGNCLILRLGAFDDGDVNTLPEPGNPGLSGHTAITMDKSSDNPVNPAGWWKLDETSGLTAADSSGYGYNGTLTNMAGSEWTTGKINGALTFDGTNDYVSVSSLDSKYDNSSTFTVAGWFKTSQSTGMQTIVGQWVQDDEAGYEYYGWQVLVENNKVIARFGYEIPTYDVTGTSTVNNDVWHHFAMVHNGTNVAVYVDGQPERTGTANFYIYNTKFRIGDGSARIGNPPLKGGPFKGIIDDVRIYDRALSATEIAQLAGGTVSGGAGYVRQSASGSSGTSNFSLGSSNEAMMITIAIAPAGNDGYDCCGDYLQP